MYNLNDLLDLVWEAVDLDTDVYFELEEILLMCVKPKADEELHEKLSYIIWNGMDWGIADDLDYTLFLVELGTALSEMELGEEVVSKVKYLPGPKK